MPEAVIELVVQNNPAAAAIPSSSSAPLSESTPPQNRVPSSSLSSQLAAPQLLRQFNSQYAALSSDPAQGFASSCSNQDRTSSLSVMRSNQIQSSTSETKSSFRFSRASIERARSSNLPSRSGTAYAEPAIPLERALVHPLAHVRYKAPVHTMSSVKGLRQHIAHYLHQYHTGFFARQSCIQSLTPLCRTCHHRHHFH
jgi:hypothetical protein